MRLFKTSLIILSSLIIFHGITPAYEPITMRAELDPSTILNDSGFINVGDDVLINIIMNQNSGALVMGVDFQWELYGENGLESIVYRDIGGHSANGSIKFLSYLTPYSAFTMFFLTESNWDGALPDQFGYMGFNMKSGGKYLGWPSDNTERTYIQIGLTVNEPGVLCIDSINLAPVMWSFDPAVGAVVNGPFCWTVQNINPNCCLDWGIIGDSNKDGIFNLSDILNCISYLYVEPIGEPQAADGCNALYDADGDGESAENPHINLTDALNMISNLYVEPVGWPTICCPPGCIVP